MKKIFIFLTLALFLLGGCGGPSDSAPPSEEGLMDQEEVVGDDQGVRLFVSLDVLSFPITEEANPEYRQAEKDFETFFNYILADNPHNEIVLVTVNETIQDSDRSQRENRMVPLAFMNDYDRFTKREVINHAIATDFILSSVCLTKDYILNKSNLDGSSAQGEWDDNLKNIAITMGPGGQFGTILYGYLDDPEKGQEAVMADYASMVADYEEIQAIGDSYAILYNSVDIWEPSSDLDRQLMHAIENAGYFDIGSNEELRQVLNQIAREITSADVDIYA